MIHRYKQIPGSTRTLSTPTRIRRGPLPVRARCSVPASPVRDCERVCVPAPPLGVFELVSHGQTIWCTFDSQYVTRGRQSMVLRRFCGLFCRGR